MNNGLRPNAFENIGTNRPGMPAERQTIGTPGDSHSASLALHQSLSSPDYNRVIRPLKDAENKQALPAGFPKSETLLTSLQTKNAALRVELKQERKEERKEEHGAKAAIHKIRNEKAPKEELEKIHLPKEFKLPEREKLKDGSVEAKQHIRPLADACAADADGSIKLVSSAMKGISSATEGDFYRKKNVR